MTLHFEIPRREHDMIIRVHNPSGPVVQGGPNNVPKSLFQQPRGADVSLTSFFYWIEFFFMRTHNNKIEIEIGGCLAALMATETGWVFATGGGAAKKVCGAHTFCSSGQSRVTLTRIQAEDLLFIARE